MVTSKLRVLSRGIAAAATAVALCAAPAWADRSAAPIHSAKAIVAEAAPDGSLLRLLEDERDRMTTILSVATRLQLDAEAAAEGPALKAARLALIAAQNAEMQDAQAMLGEIESDTITELLIADPGRITLPAAIDRVVVGEKHQQWYCLAEGLYFEARGESVMGQFAVAEVILNRVDSGRYPDTVCAVLNQGAEKLNACQFSYNCDGHAEEIHEPKAWDRVGKVAWLMLEGRPRSLTGNATHYHATHVSPRWSKKLKQTARIGDHVFYRYRTQVSQR
ncbi:MAG: cell wall hydrolase [Pseudomonadota bacterium]